MFRALCVSVELTNTHTQKRTTTPYNRERKKTAAYRKYPFRKGFFLFIPFVLQERGKETGRAAKKLDDCWVRPDQWITITGNDATITNDKRARRRGLLVIKRTSGKWRIPPFYPFLHFPHTRNASCFARSRVSVCARALPFVSRHFVVLVSVQNTRKGGHKHTDEHTSHSAGEREGCTGTDNTERCGDDTAKRDQPGGTIMRTQKWIVLRCPCP